MRTTLEIDDEVLAVARAIARAEAVSIGTAISRLARQGIEAIGAIDTTGVFPAFQVEYPAPPITLEQVNEHRD